MDSEIDVREATQQDTEAIYELACELSTTVGDSEPESEDVGERLSQLLESPSSNTLVAEGADGIVGVVSFWVKPDLAHGDTVIDIPMLAVSQGARRQGIGKLLMKRTQDIASENDAEFMELIATPNNKVAREFYHSLGFVETDHVCLEFRGDIDNPPDPDEC
ncbi:hypothetical protein BH23ACT11_BH23ACT11_21230 [soil metagenome]